MTESPTTTTTVAEPTTEDTTAPEPTFADGFQKMAYEQLEELIAERNSLVGTVNAANGDKSALREQIMEESTDDDIVAAREARDEAIERLEALVKPLIDAIVNESSSGLADTEEKVKELEQKIKPGISYYKKMYGDDASEFLTPLTRVRSARIGNTGTGGRRIRGFNLTVTLNGEVTDYESFSAAAKALDTETSVLQDAFLEAAGNPKQIKDAPDKVSFTLTVTEVDEDENETASEAVFLAYRPDSENEGE